MNRSRRADNSDNRGGRGQPPNKRMRAGSPKDRYYLTLNTGFKKLSCPGRKKHLLRFLDLSYLDVKIITTKVFDDVVDRYEIDEIQKNVVF